jgi:hypothetical protein
MFPSGDAFVEHDMADAVDGCVEIRSHYDRRLVFNDECRPADARARMSALRVRKPCRTPLRELRFEQAPLRRGCGGLARKRSCARRTFYFR